MTLQVGDKVVTLPLRDGGRVTVRSGTIAVGDKAVLIPGANGQLYAVRPASPQVGDKVILYPLRNGGHVCLASADDEGGSSPSVMPPGNFDARRTGPSTAVLDWLPGEGNTAVRIVRRPDRYPTHINDGTVAYEGAGDETTDAGLDSRDWYYYCAWGKAGSRYSNGYLMDGVGAWLTGDFVVEFEMKIDSFAPDYASHPMARGEMSDGSLWVWVFYLYGQNSDGLTGRLMVRRGQSTSAVALSGTSGVLITGKTYRVRWEYSEAGGGRLFIDGSPAGGVSGGGKLPTSLSSDIHYGDNVYNGDGRSHSDFDGDINLITLRQIR